MDVVVSIIAHRGPPLSCTADPMPGTPHRTTGRNRLFEFSIGRPCCRITGLARPRPQHPTARVGRRCSAAPSPVGGEQAEHPKMAACLIFKRPLRVIFKPPAENARTQGKPPFSHVRSHATKEAKAKIESRRSPSNEAPSVVSHKVESRRPLRVACCIDPPQTGLRCGDRPRRNR